MTGKQSTTLESGDNLTLMFCVDRDEEAASLRGWRAACPHTEVEALSVGVVVLHIYPGYWSREA